jgi:hypothetical protein
VGYREKTPLVLGGLLLKISIRPAGIYLQLLAARCAADTARVKEAKILSGPR